MFDLALEELALLEQEMKRKTDSLDDQINKIIEMIKKLNDQPAHQHGKVGGRYD